MTRQTALAVLAAAGVLLLALWVSGADEVWFMNDNGPSDQSSQTERRNVETDDVPQPRERAADAESEDNFGFWFNIVATVFLAALAVALVVLLVRRTSSRRRSRRRARERQAQARAAPSALADPIDVRRELAEATDELHEMLMEGSPRNAIVRCWVALEEACSGAGVARHPAETSVEFTTRVLGTFALDEGSVVRLADLYREARFSAHVLGEAQREAALASLREVQLQLRDRVRRDTEAHP